MRRAVAVARAGTWPAPAPERATLAYDQRHRRRRRLASDDGAPFLLDLEDATVLGDGDGLRLDDGGWIEVRAAPEAIVEAHCDDGLALARLAWHLGNRHVPAQILGDRVRFRDDAVIVAMVEGLGARVVRLCASFTPEPGAYDKSGGHSHG